MQFGLLRILADGTSESTSCFIDVVGVKGVGCLLDRLYGQLLLFWEASTKFRLVSLSIFRVFSRFFRSTPGYSLHETFP